MASGNSSILSPALDADSRAWLESLADDARGRDAAIARLHALLLRAARFEVARRRAALHAISNAELDDLAQQSADDALLALLSKLDQFRGQSRFTTWAYKFALLEAAVKLRRRPWQDREIPLEPEAWSALADPDRLPDALAEQRELLEVMRGAIDTELTPRQREVLIAVAVNGVPIDVVAERLGSSRGALYKTIHDARAKLRRVLEAAGHTLEVSAEGASR